MRWIVFLLLNFAPPPASPLEPLDQERINQLVQQLGSPSQQDHEQAEKRLSSADPEVLDQLPRSSRPGGVSQALDRVRASLEKSAAKRAGLASTVSLEGRVSPREIESAILKETGQAVLFGNGQRDLLDVDWKNVAYWDAVQQLESRTDTVATGDRIAEAMILKPAENAPIAASSGPCRIEVVKASRRTNLVDPSKDLIQVRWRLRSEPRLRPLYLITADRDCTLTDGSTVFAPLSPEARREIPCDRWQGCEIDTAFQIPANLDASKVEFSTTSTLKVAALPLKLRFDDLQSETPPPKRRGAVTGTVRNLRADSPTKTLALDIVVAYDKGGPEFESHRMWIYQNAGWLEQKSGNRIVTPDSVSLKQIGVAGATLRYEFENVPAEVSELAFVYEAPSMVIDVPVSITGLQIPVHTP